MRMCLGIIAIEIVWGYVTMVQWNREARLQQRPEYCHSYWNSSLSDDIIYHDEYDDGYIYNKQLGTRTVTGISWIRKSEDGDNLVCFKKGEHRGYFTFIPERRSSLQNTKRLGFSLKAWLA